MLKLVRTIDDALDLRDWLMRQPFVAIDTETTGFEVFASDFEIRIAQFGNENEAWVMEVPGWEGFINKMLSHYTGKIVMHNCFSGDTEFLTRHGVKKFEDVVGQTVEVLTDRSRWIEAEVRNYGKAQLLKITLRRRGRSGRSVKTIFATANHNWLVRTGQKVSKKVTSDLVEGDRLKSLSNKLPSRVTPSSWGVAAGIVYGDGTKYLQGKSSKVVLFGDKESLVKFFPLSPTREVAYGSGLRGTEVSNLPGFLKDAPSIEESSAPHLYGWLAGLFATDGNISATGQMSITGSLEAMSFARDVCVSLGIQVNGLLKQTGKTGYGQTRDIYKLSIFPGSLEEGFFIRPDQLERFRKPDARGEERDWYVESVEVTDRVEDVFCVEVPEYGTFTLLDNIHTGNSSYDMKAFEQEGITIPWHQVDDTMIALRLVEPAKPAALKVAAARYISTSAADSQKDLHSGMKKHGWDWATVPVDFYPYIFYAAMDVILTSRLYMHPKVQEGMNSPVYQMEMDYRALCCRMERNGMRVDVPFCEEAMFTLTDEIDTRKESILDKFDVHVTSNASLAKWLMERGAPLTKTTAGGAPSVDRESLSSLRSSLTDGSDLAVVVDSALRVRDLTKLKSSYFSNFLELNVDGLLHPSIETIAARTGRSSIRNPALQTLPRGDNPDAKMVRRAVIPRNPGELLLTSDYSQVELRLIAMYSKDPDLQSAFLVADAEGGDFFTESTRAVYEEPDMPKNDPRRTTVKTLFYSSAYGAGVDKMAATAKVPVHEMKEVSDRVFSKYPGIKRFMKECENTARENGDWIFTPSGRKVWVDPEKPYVALNCFIQGHAGDILKQSAIDMAKAGLDEFMVVPIHDEVLFSIPEDQVEDAKPIIRDCMSRPDEVVPLLAEPSDGAARWSEIDK